MIKLETVYQVMTDAPIVKAAMYRELRDVYEHLMEDITTSLQMSYHIGSADVKPVPVYEGDELAEWVVDETVAVIDEIKDTLDKTLDELDDFPGADLRITELPVLTDVVEDEVYDRPPLPGMAIDLPPDELVPVDDDDDWVDPPWVVEDKPIKKGKVKLNLRN